MPLCLSRLQLPSVIVLLCLSSTSSACTLFKTTLNGQTIVGNNEDAWSINAKIRFEIGKAGEFGAVYLAHFNGHPFRTMNDQGGMNSEGLMFDALVVEPKNVRAIPGKRGIDYAQLMPMVMRSCSTVHDAEMLIRSFDLSWLTQSMIFLVDRNGEYLIVESDTLIIGRDPYYAVGNFRPSACSNFDAVPIERYQRGRDLLRQGPDTSISSVIRVLEAMRACRTKLGNGTLYSNIFDLTNGSIHLYFYHDFSAVRTFNLNEELEKGDHEFELAALFPNNAEFEELLHFRTPFHSHALFWFVVAMSILFSLTALYGSIALIRTLFSKHTDRKLVRSGSYLLICLSSALVIVVIPFTLFQEQVFYFGLASASDPISHAIKYVPLVIAILGIPMLFVAIRAWRSNTRNAERGVLLIHASALSIMAALFGYWGLIIP